MSTPLITLVSLFLLFSVVKIADIVSVQLFKKPLWVHLYWHKRRLTAHELKILRANFPFYNKLSNRYKTYFEHRLATFIHKKNFVGRENLVIDDEKEVRIAATVTMLTFGMRKYQLPLIQHVLVYPAAFYSKANDEMHKGEFNPKMRALVLSWEDFIAGYDDTHDNINLGIHEFTHAIHLNCLRHKSTTATLFIASFNELHKVLHNPKIKEKLLSSGYFRSYAFTNKFEFLAVAVESFIESPVAFRQEFPLVYEKIRQMLNFRFSGY